MIKCFARAIFVTAVLCSTNLYATMAFADTGDLNWYVGGRLLPALSSVDSASQTGGQGREFVVTSDQYDTTIGTSLLVGQHWSQYDIPLRTEIELGYRFRTDFNSREKRDTNNPQIGYKNDLSSTSLMVSGFYDISTGSPWRPYIGAGVGWARNSSSTTRASSSGAFTSQTLDTDVDNFAYSLQIGARVAISPDWVGEIGYRYINYGEVDSGRFSAGDQITADALIFHDIVIGIAYLF